MFSNKSNERRKNKVISAGKNKFILNFLDYINYQLYTISGLF